MRACPAALATFLAGANDQAVQTDLYTFRLADGSFVRCTGGLVALTLPSAAIADANSLNYGASHAFALGPGFGRSKMATKIGVEAAELDIDVLAGANDLIGSFTWQQCARMGIFDGATVELDRLFGTSATDTSLGALVWFYGRVAEVDVGRSKVTFKVKSLLDLLAINQFPRRLYHSSCNFRFGDAMCAYDRVNGKNAAGVATGAGQVTVTAQSGTTQGLIGTGAAVASYYAEGTVTGATGANAGIRRTIANTGNGTQIGLFQAFLYPIAPGDTFTLLPGCDHTVSTCENTFNNLARYGGFPHIPPPEAAI